METLAIKKEFNTVIRLVKEASTQDVMLINETSPAMVRFLNKDNKFRTFQLSEEGTKTQLKTTKSDDPKEALEDFLKFVDSVGAEKKKDKKQKEDRLVELNALSLEEAKSRREEINKSKELERKETIKRVETEAKAKKGIEEKALSKKTTTKKKPATKKKPSKKKIKKK